MPTKPSVLPSSSTPRNLARSHLPDRMDASPRAMLRAKDSISPKACSAAETLLASGALTTRMPRRVASSRSMLSTPTPARPTTRNREAASMSSLSTRVPLRTTSPSAPPRRPAGGREVPPPPPPHHKTLPGTQRSLWPAPRRLQLPAVSPVPCSRPPNRSPRLCPNHSVLTTWYRYGAPRAATRDMWRSPGMLTAWHAGSSAR